VPLLQHDKVPALHACSCARSKLGAHSRRRIVCIVTCSRCWVASSSTSSTTCLASFPAQRRIRHAHRSRYPPSSQLSSVCGLARAGTVARTRSVADAERG
jgi:hypothetical protein